MYARPRAASWGDRQFMNWNQAEIAHGGGHNKLLMSHSHKAHTHTRIHTYSIDHKIPNSSAHVSVSVSLVLLSRRARMRPFDLANLM